MSDDDIYDRRTPVPETPPPPWERGTGTGGGGFDPNKTQPLQPPTAESVLEVFGHFRQEILERISARDANILKAIQDVGSHIAEHYERETRRGDEHAAELKRLRRRTHGHSTDIQAINLRIAQIEQKLGIDPPPPKEPEPDSVP